MEALHQFVLWAMPALDKLPRAQRFLLGDRLQTALLDTLDALVKATWIRDRQHALMAANRSIDRARHLFRLAFELRHLDARRHKHAQRHLDEIGRLIGGWRKADRRHADQVPDAPAK